MRPERLPRRPMRTVSPSRAALDGSPTTQYWNVSPRAASVSMTLSVPSSAAPSSSLVMSMPSEPAARGWRSAKRRHALIIAARLPFMSAAPRPMSRSSCTVAANGSTSHCSRGPAGTTSVWPANTSAGAARPRRAHRLSTSPNLRRSVVNPAFARSSAISVWQPASAGETDGRRMSSRARLSVSIASYAPASRTVGFSSI